ncbi:MAG: hypothetical protein LUD84_06265, partial [Clostridiales bacterium]|nr:hypothetical protein [Clostridiales bacterium]
LSLFEEFEGVALRIVTYPPPLSGEAREVVAKRRMDGFTPQGPQGCKDLIPARGRKQTTTYLRLFTFYRNT